MESQNQQINSNQNEGQNTSINAASFGAKYATKREVYRFLSSEARIYLPSYETVTIFHMRDLVADRRRLIKLDDVKVINVPYFEGLSIEKMLEWAAKRPEKVMDALPMI